MKTFEFTQFREGICSTHRGILGTYTTNFRVNITNLKVEYGWPNQRIGFTNVIIINKRTPGFENMQERSDNNPPKDLADCKGSKVSNSTQPEEERMQGSDYRNN